LDFLLKWEDTVAGRTPETAVSLKIKGHFQMMAESLILPVQGLYCLFDMAIKYAATTSEELRARSKID
jgi:hypothetical protein